MVNNSFVLRLRYLTHKSGGNQFQEAYFNTFDL